MLCFPAGSFQEKLKPEDVRQAFVETYLSYPTKADQFASFKRFGDQVMHLGDAHDRGVLTGEKNVRNLEHKLAKVTIPQPVQVIGHLL